MNVFLVIRSQIIDCEPKLQIRVFNTYDKAAECSRNLIQEALAEWKESISDELTEYDSNQEYKDDEVLYEIYDKGNACDILEPQRVREQRKHTHLRTRGGITNQNNNRAGQTTLPFYINPLSTAYR